VGGGQSRVAQRCGWGYPLALLVDGTANRALIEAFGGKRLQTRKARSVEDVAAAAGVERGAAGQDMTHVSAENIGAMNKTPNSEYNPVSGHARRGFVDRGQYTSILTAQDV